MRHCGNCEYSYKDEDIATLGSNEDQLAFFPEVGTCCLGLLFEDGTCTSHKYMDDEPVDNFELLEKEPLIKDGPVRTLKRNEDIK